MDDRQIRSFITAAREGSFSKAAPLCYVSTPSFAQRIKSLETELGFDLFVRGSQGVSLTDAGASFLQTAQAAVSLLDEGVRRAAALDRRQVRVGHISTEPFPSYFPAMIDAFAQQHPDIEVVFRFATEDTWVEGVRDGLSDVCFSVPPSDDGWFPGLRYGQLFDDPLMLCVSPHSPLARRTSVAAENLIGETLYLQPEYAGHSAFEGLFGLQGRGVKVTEASFDQELIMHVLLEGNGAIPIPEQYQASCCPPLVAVKFDWPAIPQGVIYRDDASSTVLDFVASARDYFQSQRS